MGLWFFLLLLSDFCWRRLKNLCKLLDGMDWQWGKQNKTKLGLALVGKAFLSEILIKLSIDGWGCASSLLVVWPEVTQP